MTKPVQHDVTQLLRGTREVLVRDGWRRGAPAGTYPNKDGCKCVLNAKRVAVWLAFSAPEQIGVIPPEDFENYIDLSSKTEDVLSDAVDALYHDELNGRASGGTRVIIWNDTVCQTQEQALAMVDKAIELSVLDDIAKEKVRANRRP